MEMKSEWISGLKHAQAENRPGIFLRSQGNKGYEVSQGLISKASNSKHFPQATLTTYSRPTYSFQKQITSLKDEATSRASQWGSQTRIGILCKDGQQLIPSRWL